MKRLALFPLLAALGFLSACGDSNGPRPTVAGTWHVVTGAFSPGTISPSTFDAVVTAAGDSFTVTMPNITWTNGVDLTFNGPATVWVNSDTNYFAWGKVLASPTQRCQYFYVYGLKNAGRDTLNPATIGVTNADTVPGGYCGTPNAYSISGTVTKQ